MSSERGGGGGELARARAESFARHLTTRLRSLSGGGGADHDWTSDLSSSSDNETFYDIESPLGSPDGESVEPTFTPLQRSDSSASSASLFFDSVEELPPAARVVPLLHLKTEPPVVNGHPLVLDADIGCSRVREISSDEVDCLAGNEDVEETEGNKDHANNGFENNNTIRDESGEQSIVPCDFDEEEIKCLCSDGQEVAEVLELSDEEDCTTGDAVCVFCDIEQIKSTLSNELVESDHLCNGVDEDADISRVDDADDKECVEVEENVPLSDLLQLLKEEISNDKEQNSNKDSLSVNGHGTDESHLPCPSIEIQPTTDDNVIKVGDEEFDIEVKRKNFRRSSSLKSGKTPPGTPGRKKIVRFADVLGLDLADVKTFLDEVPTIPKSAYEDLHGIEMTPSPVESFNRITIVTSSLPVKILQPLFQQPCVQPNFLDRVRQQNVCLENAMVSDMALFAITGLVRVRNIDFHKYVYIRYSINEWRSFSDLQARYVPNSCDGFSDKFTFVLYAHTLAVGQTLQFAVRFQAGGGQFWDSNGGLNYKFECVTRAPSDPDPATLGLDSATFY